MGPETNRDFMHLKSVEKNRNEAPAVELEQFQFSDGSSDGKSCI
jgi:hypothetical protein